ncbi:MAG: hypothetical protein SGILL_001872 [Bacillariaceae sp.]
MWTDNATVNVFIHYHSEETGSSVCEAQEDLNYEDSFTKELICYDGWTDVGLFVYFDDEFSIEECDECTPPSTDVDNVIAYYFEVPCEPICIVPSSAPSMADTEELPQVVSTEPPTSSPTTSPTECPYPEAELISTSGSPTDISETTIQITGPNTETIDFDIVQDMIENDNLDEFAVRYLDENFVEVCEQFTDIAYLHTESFTAACVDNITSVSLFIYVGDDFDISECNACTAPIEGSDDYEAYQFELPCVYECPEEPEEPQVLSTGTPTGSPTGSPTETPEDPNCPEIDVTNPDTNGVLDASVIEITTQSTDNVDFVVSLDAANSVISVQYFSGGASTCVSNQEDSAPLPIQAACEEGWTQVVVSLYLGDGIEGSECDFCSPPSADSGIEYSTMTVEVPCTPCPDDVVAAGAALATDAPVVVALGSSCTDQNVKIDWTGERDMWCEETSLPGVILVENQNGGTVEFTVHNSMGSDAIIEVEYDDGTGVQCQSLGAGQLISSGGQHLDTLEATCVDGVATVTLFSDNNSNSHAANGKTCHDNGQNTCHVVYTLPCEGDNGANPCDAENARKLGGPIQPLNAESDNIDEDGPYCLNKNSPCTGDEANMVYVCHYSSRGGYQTFCIPEADSDIMRFYSNDYCGPCEGWNGVSHAGQSI